MTDNLLKIFELIESSNPDICICVTDNMLDLPGPHILYVNKRWQQVTGYSSEEVIGKTPRILQGPKSNKEALKLLKEALKQGKRFEGTTTNYAKDGTEINMTWLSVELTESDCFIAIQKVNEEPERILKQLKDIASQLMLKLKEYS
jgi:PAS domain S-box-containing protein